MFLSTVAAWFAKHRKLLILGGLAVVAYLGAFNRPQALPWAIGALLTATLVTGYAWPRWLIKGLSVTRQGPSRAEEGARVLFRIVVQNHGWLPRFMVEITDHLPFAQHAAPLEGPFACTLGVVPYLPGNATRSFDVPVDCELRGRHRVGPVGLASRFPLGFIEARYTQDNGARTLTIYPDVFDLTSLPLRGAPSQIHRGGYLLREGAGAVEFLGLREYRRGDNPRHIHWPSTARLNELIVREYEPLASACLYLVMDQAIDSNVGTGKHSSFEYAVRIAASVARFGCAQSIRTRVAGQGRLPLRELPGVGDSHYQEILDQLAVIKCDGVRPYASLLEEIGPSCLRGETVVAFLSENDARTTKTLRSLALLRARQVNLLAVVFDQPSYLSSAARGNRACPDRNAVMSTLFALGAQCVAVRKGDDLAKLFNS